MPNLLPFLLLGGAALMLTRKKSVVVSEPRVVTLKSRDELASSLGSLSQKRGRPYVVLGFRGYGDGDTKAPQIGRIRQIFAETSASYPQVDFFEYPENMPENFKALAVTGGVRVKNGNIEILHMDADPEGEWAILTTDEASGDFSRAAQWAAGKVEVESQVNVSEMIEQGKDMAEALFKAISGGGGQPMPGPMPGPGRYLREIICLDNSCTWKIFDQETKQLMRAGEEVTKDAANAAADAAMAELGGA
jgi:hypothetical protein